jgi:hypothetical protein
MIYVVVDLNDGYVLNAFIERAKAVEYQIDVQEMYPETYLQGVRLIG